MKPVAINLAVCATILVIGAGIILLVLMPQWATSVSDESQQPPAARASVLVQPVERVLVEDRLSLTGTVRPWLDMTVSSEGMGKIEQLSVREGETVHAGSELARVNTESIRTRLDQARAEATLAEQEYERAQSLAQRGVSAARDLDAAVARLDVTRATLQALQIELDKSVIRAPFDSVVETLFREAQEFIEIGAPLARLVQVHEVKVVVGIPERDVAYFKEDDTVEVRVDALPDQVFEGRIHRIATTADPSTHTFTTEIAVDNRERHIRPGMIARGALIRKSYPDSMLIPIFSSLLLDDQRFVFVVEDETARLRAVRSGIVQGGSVQIVDGLEAGDLLIVRGQYDVRDGDLVRIQESTRQDPPG